MTTVSLCPIPVAPAIPGAPAAAPAVTGPAVPGAGTPLAAATDPASVAAGAFQAVLALALGLPTSGVPVPSLPAPGLPATGVPVPGVPVPGVPATGVLGWSGGMPKGVTLRGRPPAGGASIHSTAGSLSAGCSSAHLEMLNDEGVPLPGTRVEGSALTSSLT